MTKYLDINSNPRPPHQFPTPEIIGYFTVDQDWKQNFNADNLKYVWINAEKFLPFDLNKGFENYVDREPTLENEEKISRLIGWLSSSSNLSYLSDSIISNSPKKTYVCCRGLLSALSKTPYETQDDWLVCACKVKNLVFLCAFYTDKKKEEIKKGKYESEELFSFWGRKFEQYMLSENPRYKPDTSKTIVCGEFCLIYQTCLNSKHKLLFSAEIDGIEATDALPEVNLKSLNKSRFVELKTSRVGINHVGNGSFCKYKTLKWWIQSYLVGIRHIVLGERDDQGLLVNLKSFRIADLPRIADGIWHPKVCMNFLDDFLSFVGNILDEEPDFTTWKFSWKPNDTQVKGKKVTDPKELEIYDFVPLWFRDECMKLCQKQEE